jgi:hypothetical protein
MIVALLNSLYQKYEVDSLVPAHYPLLMQDPKVAH